MSNRINHLKGVKGESFHQYQETRVEMRKDMIEYLDETSTVLANLHAVNKEYFGASEDSLLNTIIAKLDKAVIRIDENTKPYERKRVSTEEEEHYITEDDDPESNVLLASEEYPTEHDNVIAPLIEEDNFLKALNYAEYSIGELRTIYNTRTGKETKAKRKSLVTMLKGLDK